MSLTIKEVLTELSENGDCEIFDNGELFLVENEEAGIIITNGNGNNFVLTEYFDSYQATLLGSNEVEDVYAADELFATVCMDFFENIIQFRD